MEMMNVVTTKTRKWAVVATQTTDVVGGLRDLLGGPKALRGRLPDERPYRVAAELRGELRARSLTRVLPATFVRGSSPSMVLALAHRTGAARASRNASFTSFGEQELSPIVEDRR